MFRCVAYEQRGRAACKSGIVTTIYGGICLKIDLAALLLCVTQENQTVVLLSSKGVLDVRSYSYNLK